VIGDQLSDPHGLRGNGVALVVSLLVAVYGTLGVARIQNTMNGIWAVPCRGGRIRCGCACAASR
jgi:hypothetical protein